MLQRCHRRSRVWTVLEFLVLTAGCGDQEDASSAKRDPAAQPAALSSAASDLFALRNLARLHAARNTDEGNAEAVRLLEQVVQSEAAGLDRLNLARVLVFTQRFAEAGPHLTAAAQDPAASGPALDYVTGIFHTRMEDHPAAAAAFAKVTEALPRHLQAWYQRGYAEERSGALEPARTSYGKALEIDPSFRAALYRLVLVSRQLRDPGADALFARFQAVPQEGQPETEKCDLTRVDLRPLDRARVEPPAVPLVWKDLTAQFLGENAQGAQRAIGVFQGDSCAVLLLPPANAPHAGPRLVGVHGWTGRVELSLPGAWDACAGDLDNDGRQDLVFTGPSGLAVWMGEPGLRFTSAPRAFPEATDGVAALQLWDHDHDGDLDVLALLGGPPAAASAPPVTDSAAAWFRNNGDRTFTQVHPGPFPAVPSRAAGVWGAPFDAHDFDLGNDLDAVFCSASGAPSVFLNRRDGSFAFEAASAVSGGTIARAEDLDNDGAADLIAFAPTRAGSAWSVARNAARDGLGHVSFEAHGRTGEIPFAVRDVVLADPDNDGDLDALLATSGGFVTLRNAKGGHFSAEPPVTVIGGGAVTVSAADLDADGRLEALVGTAEGTIVVLSVAEDLPYAAWSLRLQGGRDNRDGIGTIGEHYAGGAYQSCIARGPEGIRFGLGVAPVSSGRPQIEGVRLRWPQGIVQSELATDLVFETPQIAHVTQDEGLVASCPFLYAQGPEGWRFLTDIVGIAPLDEWLPPGSSPAFDPEEFVRIPGEALAAVDGRLRLAVTEELRETTYLDRVELLAVDHPESTAAFANESTRQGAYDSLKVYLFSLLDLSAPREVNVLGPSPLPGDGSRGGALPRATASAAGSADSRNATARVATLDGEYLHPYPAAPTQWSGWVERHDLELVAPPDARWILLTGRIHWYDSTVSFALHQHGRTWGPLRLEEVNAAGERSTLVPDLGLPCGMDRTMVSAFSGGTRSSDAGARLVLSAHHRFLWDRILFASHADSFVFASGPPAPHRTDESDSVTPVMQRVDLERADLEEHGFSATSGSRALHEQIYLFADAGPADDFERARGSATRYGDVLQLLRDHDDELVVLVAGDRAVLEFSALPEPVTGWTRTYFLRVTGWAKEGSFHNRTGRFIEPLPFRGMEAYPPAPGAAGAFRRAYLDTYRTREIRG